MKNLSLEKAEEIIRLAEANSEKEKEKGPANGIFSVEDIRAAMTEPETEEHKALISALGLLDHKEALDLVALMYVGRGDYVENSEDKVNVLQAFNMQVRDFEGKDVNYLVDTCSRKSPVLHQYLRKGLNILK